MYTQWTSGVLVVVEGARRLMWVRRGSGWRLAGCWPSPLERSALLTRLDQGEPLLVVVEPGSEMVPALAEEVETLPEAVRVLDRDRDVLELEVSRFDWLPAALRERGERFVAEAVATVQTTPLSALPALLTEPAVAGAGGVRFAVRTRACRVLSTPLVDAAAAAAFRASVALDS